MRPRGLAWAAVLSGAAWAFVVWAPIELLLIMAWGTVAMLGIVSGVRRERNDDGDA